MQVEASMNRAQLVVGTLSPTPRGCERIYERNAAKPPRWAGTRRDGWDGRLAATCTFETRKPLRDVDRLAHNPEVAGSNPVPATSGNDPRGATSGVIFMPFVNGFVNVGVC